MTSVLTDPSTALARADALARDRERLETVGLTRLLDSGVQPDLQSYAELAARLTGAPMALVSVIASDRQYFSANVGVDGVDEMPLERSLCKYVLAEGHQLSVPDLRNDPGLAGTPAATELGIRGYLGSPVRAGGSSVGSVCVADFRPHDWDDTDRQLIRELARAAAAEFDLRIHATRARYAALTDPLTGLGNRAALARELARALAEGRTLHVGMFDLDGFQRYNDLFGHPAGDDLLRRLARRLARAAGPESSFRMGGDEFCVLACAHETLVRARDALNDQGPGYHIAASIGVARIPDEASDPTSAIAIADHRMYASKRPRQISVEEQVTEVLTRALAVRDDPLSTHSSEVSRLARAVAIELGLTDDAIRDVELASVLHDIGKLGISDSVLSKPGPLDAEEWAQMRCHTLIGERIVGGAPSLGGTAALIRSSHERFDGDGYPDGLSGEQIPEGSRIILACDAYDAMTSDRAYRRGMGHAAALDELQRGAGTQFDPRVVAALCRCLPPRHAG